ncbi:MAG TPA: HAD family phosphatase [Verrucomicrobiae bacterium]|nr:HAD family phosphatase [Verrucomicrobiae bacterium]
MEPVKSVVFDLGKVLVDFDYGIAGRKLASRATMAAADLGRFLVSVPLIVRYETGLITSQEFYQEVRAASGYLGDLEEFASLFADIFTPIQPMIDLHAQIRAKGFPTYIFSNTNELAVRFIRQGFPFFHHFDDYILSYEHGSMKPDAKLYEVVESRTGARGAEILYVDDRPENIEAGMARGWRAILHETPEKTRASIESLGLLRPA